jgi:hypothetical protein
MNTEPVTHQFVAVLSKKIELGRAFNALGHMTAGLVSLYAEDLKLLRFQSYFDQDGGEHSNISDNPFIVLKADNSNKIRELRKQLLGLGIKFTDFTSTMVEGTFVEQHERTKQTKEEALEYFGLCFFCEREKARELTRKFSVYS